MTKRPVAMVSTPYDRRRFLKQVAAGTIVASVGLRSSHSALADMPTSIDFAFFVIGDTHYLANRDQPSAIDDKSAAVCGGLVDTLNRLAGTEIPEAAGGGKVLAPQGVIHAGDVIDTGDKNGAVQAEMQKTELARFREDYGLTGKDGRLKCPVFEVAGNHDSPHGEGPFIRTSFKTVSKR